MVTPVVAEALNTIAASDPFLTTYQVLPFDPPGATIFLLTPGVPVTSSTAYLAWLLADPSPLVSVTLADVTSIVTDPPIATSTGSVSELLTTVPHVPSSEPLTGLASFNKDV